MRVRVKGRGSKVKLVPYKSQQGVWVRTWVRAWVRARVGVGAGVGVGVGVGVPLWVQRGWRMSGGCGV